MYLKEIFDKIFSEEMIRLVFKWAVDFQLNFDYTIKPWFVTGCVDGNFNDNVDY